MLNIAMGLTAANQYLVCPVLISELGSIALSRFLGNVSYEVLFE